MLYVSEFDFISSPLVGKWFKMISGTMEAEVDPQFWAPIRNSVVSNFAGSVEESKPALPVVTYISRQGGGRRLTKESDLSLVSALQELQVEGICQVYVAQMEKMTLHAQIELVSRSTVSRELFFLLLDIQVRFLDSCRRPW